MSDILALLDRSGAYVYKGQLRLPTYTSYGCYPIFYYTAKFETLCSDCATTDYFEWLYTLTVNPRDGEVAAWMYDPPVLCDVYWEGPAENCASCNKLMESAYGDPDDTGDTDLGDPRPPENLPYIEPERITP